MVFDASPNASVQIVEGPSGMPVRIDPSAPGAQPVCDLLTPEPFRNLEQELTGAIKAWKTSNQLLNEAQIYKAYEGRRQIDDDEVLELLLRSSWERHLPGYLWAGRIDGQKLCDIIVEILSGCPLLRAEKSRRNPRDTDTVLISPENGRPYDVNGKRLYARMIALGERVGVEKVRPHRFRCNFAVDALLKAANVNQIAECLGDTAETVAKHYLPISTGMSESTRNILDREDAGIEALKEAPASFPPVSTMKSHAA